ncbi:AfsR/SARP family transcriptional regulator [Streptomyces luomodiensis]|uniref:AfsR/SARP family transcriptional regulator n=1 Tax=Streptomyces luomodiensis TaxID=3026192 RepID=A0ABY9V8M9_9ACTN|nr:AfsR/SARP family transcriptional regulator [Streptomyces sp. SCA4-21]WNF01238.1 AfsR/SARP family transcriptional regulator [Streptomyces sp. SCA4-21]
MRFSVLGPLTANHHGKGVPLGGLRQRTVLAFLLLHPNNSVSTQRLIGALWGANEPTTARKSVQNALSGLRKAFLTHHQSGDAPVALRTEGRGYVLRIPPEHIDLGRHHLLLERGARELADRSWEAAARTLREALGLWRGEVLADLVEAGIEWPELAVVREARWKALEDRIVADLMLGRHREVVAELGLAADAEPVRERLCRLHMVALYRTGRQTDALEVYRRTRSVLAERFGTGPGPRLRDLEQYVLAHDPELTAPGAVLRLAA